MENEKSAYRSAGVSTQAGYDSVNLMKDAVRSTYTKWVLGDIGAFASAVELPEGYRKPVLVSGTDGVGTKLIIAQKMGIHNTVGIDLVAMCVNDVACAGASPLFFLDYIACGKNYPEKIASIISGIAAGCRQASCALVGGETAEMPGMYAPDEYDLAGFAVGIAEKEEMTDPESVKDGDILIALPSSGVHSNGFSLIRKILSDKGMKLEDKLPEFEGKTLAEELLTPTRIYVPALTPLFSSRLINGMCHITGGGFLENIPRMIPDGLCAVVDTQKIPVPAIFDVIASEGSIDLREMYATFNMGAGFFIAVAPSSLSSAVSCLSASGYAPIIAGHIETSGGAGCKDDPGAKVQVLL